MNDPHEVLGLPPDADEDTIRQRYLELVRQFSPDRAPERFAAIRAAYDELREPARRVKALVFETKADTLDALTAAVRSRLRERINKVPFDDLLSLAE